MDELAPLSSSIRWCKRRVPEHNLHRTGLIQICKQDIAGYHFQTFFIVVLNIFLHLTHIYANSFNYFFYLLENDRRSVETSFFIRDFYRVKF